MSFIVRREDIGDVPAIHSVHCVSFPTDGEGKLVDSLRSAGRLTVSLVAESNGVVIGHVAFSPVSVPTGSIGLGLGPLAVVEAYRRNGVGAGLVERGLDECRAAGFGWAVVLGDPAYYSRFGFQRASTFGLHDEFHGGPAFQAMELVSGTLPADAGTVSYAREFAALT